MPAERTETSPMRLELNRRTDYAIRTAMYLARESTDRLVNAPTIARQMDVPQGYLPHIMRDLVRARVGAVDEELVRSLDRGLVGDVEKHRCKAMSGLAAQRQAIGLLAHAGEDPKTVGVEGESDRLADSRGGSGDYNGWLGFVGHVYLLLVPRVLMGMKS